MAEDQSDQIEQSDELDAEVSESSSGTRQEPRADVLRDPRVTLPRSAVPSRHQ